MSANQQRLEELRHNREKARLGGGLKKQEAIRMTGRGTARDRISMLLDDESFIEIDSFNRLFFIFSNSTSPTILYSKS